MYISLDWISDYVDLSGLSDEQIANRLTLSTAEVEGLEKIERSVEGVLIGEVVSADPISTADDRKTLHRCKVDCGKESFETVCGAPNVRVGMKAPFAPAGVKLADGTILKKTEVAGHTSEGVLCSAAELGMSQWHEMLLECPGNLKNGTPLADEISPYDTLIEIDNKSLTHRPDLWGHYGFARELAAVFQRALKPLPRHDLARYDDLPAYPLSIEDLENCPCYGCLEFEINADQPSPLILQRRLHALGQRTWNLMVDVTNYTSLEIGQPTHAFDGDKVEAIRVATFQKKGTFVTLDDQPRKLLPEDLLIWNRDEPVALAGIMGGAATEVSSETRKVLLESANFNAARIRKTSVRLDLRTDASQRYEKSQPPINVLTGVQRIMNLLEESSADFKVTRRFTLEGDLDESPREIVLPAGSLSRLSGIELSREQTLSILHSIEFGASFDEKGNLHVEIPPFRSRRDIAIGPDIIEEVLRIYGYDHIPPVMPSLPLEPLQVEVSLQLHHKARRLLSTGHRFLEVHQYGWMNDPWLDRIGFEPKNALTLHNPAALPDSRLRTTLIPNLLALIPKNRNHSDRFRLFELGSIYLPQEKKKASCREKPMLAGISYQQGNQPSLEEHYRSIKGALEDFPRLLKEPPFRFVASERQVTPWQMPDLWAEIYQGETLVGSIGTADDSLMEILAPDGGQVIWFELDFEALQGKLYPEVQFEQPPRYPHSWQDFSLLWNIGDGFAKLQERLDRFEHPLIRRREFLTSYKGKGLEKGMASYSFRFWIGAVDHTLSGEEIDQFHQAFLDFLKKEEIQLR